MPDARYRPSGPPVLHETIDHETIIVNLEIGTYYSLNPAGTSIWSGFDRGASVEEIVEVLAQQSGADAGIVQRGVSAFVEQLLAEKLLVACEGEPEASEPVTDWPDGLRFEPPALSTYTDMQELLLLDPVHDVGVGGWPQRA